MLRIAQFRSIPKLVGYCLQMQLLLVRVPKCFFHAVAGIGFSLFLNLELRWSLLFSYICFYKQKISVFCSLILNW